MRKADIVLYINKQDILSRQSISTKNVNCGDN